MIGPFKKNPDQPEYLSHYGMTRAPFSIALEDDMYYVEPTRKQRLDIVLQLIQFSSELMVITGPKGMGKTMFMRQVKLHAGQNWKYCVVEGHQMMNEEQFLQRVYSGYGIVHASIQKSAMLSHLKKRLDSMLQQSTPIVLAIDDAHLFSNKILGLILELASVKNPKTGSSVHVIMASEPQIKIVLAEPELDEKHNLIIRKIDLPPLDEMHTGNYLHHRLSQSGMSIEQFLTKKTINKIYKQSGGIPLNINEAADKMLFETTPIIRRTSHIHASKRNAAAKYTVLALLVLITIGAVFYRELAELVPGALLDSNSHQAATETITPLTLPPLSHQTPEVSNDAALPNPTVPTNNQGAVPGQSTADHQSKPMMNPVTTTDATKPSTTQLSSVTPGPGEKDQSPVTPEVKAVMAEIPATSPPTTEASSTPPVSTSATAQQQDAQQGLHDKDWIMAQDPAQYTLQLVTGHQQQTIYNFIEKYRLSGPQLAYFQTRRASKQWHNLTYGVFPTRSLAAAAIAQLPAELANTKPWIRRLSSIQAEINKSL